VLKAAARPIRPAGVAGDPGRPLLLEQQWAAAAAVLGALPAEGAAGPSAARQQFWLRCPERARVQSALARRPHAGHCCCAPRLGVLRLAAKVRLGQGNAASCSQPWNPTAPLETAELGNRLPKW